MHLCTNGKESGWVRVHNRAGAGAQNIFGVFFADTAPTSMYLWFPWCHQQREPVPLQSFNARKEAWAKARKRDLPSKQSFLPDKKPVVHFDSSHMVSPRRKALLVPLNQRPFPFIGARPRPQEARKPETNQQTESSASIKTLSVCRAYGSALTCVTVTHWQPRKRHYGVATPR